MIALLMPNNAFKREFSPVIDINFQSKPKKKQKINPENKEEIHRIHRILVNKYARIYIKFLHEKNQANHYADVHFKTAMPLSSVKKYFTHWTYTDGVKGNGNNSIKQIDRNTYSIRL